MIQCSDCGRHHFAGDDCPFCNRPRSPFRKRLGSAMAILLTPTVLTACYGGAPTMDDTSLLDDTSASTDADGDGFDSGTDCNDSDAAINPDATEVCDDTVDNDCDDLVDADDDDCT